MAALRRRAVNRRAEQAKTVPMRPPIGGLNTRDPLDDMSPLDAAVMTNWNPETSKVAVRAGHALHQASVGSGNVDTIAELHTGSLRRLVAASNGNVYNVTGSPSSLASGFTNNRWQAINMNAKIGLANGADAVQEWDGTTFQAMTLSGGITSASVLGMMVHRSRSYMFEANSQDFWYSAVNALGGAMTQFPLSRVGTFGGKLVCMGSWNVEGGTESFSAGVAEDMAVFVMSSGEIIVYAGDDPGSNFDLVGVFRAGEPVDVRGMCRVGPDLLLLTTEGVVSIAQLVRSGVFDPQLLVSAKIGPTIKAAVSDYKSNTGWQLLFNPADNRVILNVPVSATEFVQYAMNVRTGAWSKWTGLTARAWGLYNDALYFGDTGANVYKSSGVTDAGANITADLQTAYSDLGAQGHVINARGIRAVFRGSEETSLGWAAQFDHDVSNISVSTFSFGPEADVWEAIETNWEDTDENFEGAPESVYRRWLAAEGAGYSIGARVYADTDQAVALEGIDYRVSIGQGLV